MKFSMIRIRRMWDRIQDGNIIDDNAPRCGYFLNSVYKAFDRNVRNGYNMSFAYMQDYMRDCTSRGLPIVDGNNKVTKDMVGLEIEESGNLRNSVKRNLMFGRDKGNLTAFM